ncbi:hypothetical protein GGX14DRAFT_667730 [Mycena pura]|uniref:Uncharacterized protein n=1 Tax=Mycena pura TaxID=153505 RepID=A0AAD6UYP2_9AGAR|nr:hypothetical protein GGX14DRAFT_667730 [Mycena pura]
MGSSPYVGSRHLFEVWDLDDPNTPMLTANSPLPIHPRLSSMLRSSMTGWNLTKATELDKYLAIGKATALEALQGALPPAELQAMISSAMGKPKESCPCSLPTGTLYCPSAMKMGLLESASAPANSTEDVKPPLYSSISPRAKTWGSVTAHKCSRKQKSISTYSATDRGELSHAIGPDMMKPMTEIGSTLCADVRISQGPLSGLMAWRFIVQHNGSNISGASTYAAVVVNFILNMGSQKTYVDVLAELSYNLKFIIRSLVIMSSGAP